VALTATQTGRNGPVTQSYRRKIQGRGDIGREEKEEKYLRQGEKFGKGGTGKIN